MITSLIMGLHPTIARSCGRPPRLWENKEAWFSFEVRDFCPWAWRGVGWAVGVGFTHNHSNYVTTSREDLYAMARLSDGIQLFFEK